MRNGVSKTALEMTPLARADIKEIGRYTQKRWGIEQRDRYLNAFDQVMTSLRDCHRLDRARDDIKPGLLSRSCQKHVIFFTRDANGRVVVLRILGQSMEFERHLR